MTIDTDIKLPIDNGEYVTIRKVYDIELDGNLPIDFKYDGSKDIEQIKKLMIKKVNELIELAFYGEVNDR